MFTNIISWRLRRNWGYQCKFLVDYLVPFSNCFGDFKRLAACKKSADCGMLSWCQQVECCSCLKTLKVQDWTITTTTTTNKQQQQQMECGSCLKTLKLYLWTLATHLYTPWQLPLLWILLAKNLATNSSSSWCVFQFLPVLISVDQQCSALVLQ